MIGSRWTVSPERVGTARKKGPRSPTVASKPLSRGGTEEPLPSGESRPIQTRRRRLQALVLAAVAIGLVVVEPFPKGVVLLSLTQTHGVDVGDLPALALLLVAACLAI